MAQPDPTNVPVNVSSFVNAIPVATGFFATQTFTPAAAAYSALDVFDSAKVFTWTDRLGRAFKGGELMITSSVLQVAETALQTSEASYNLPLYSVTPPSAIADNGAWDVAAGDRASYLGQLSLGTPVDLGSTCQVNVDGINRQITVASTGVTYSYLVTSAAFTALAVAYKITLHAVPL